MATRFQVAALVTALLFTSQVAVAQEYEILTDTVTTTVTSTTPPMSNIERVYDKHVKSMPLYCMTKKSAQMHCAISRVLYDAAILWEQRALNEWIDKNQCAKDLGACEDALAANPDPVEPDDPSGIQLGIVGDILIYVGVAAAAGGVGYLIGRATSN